MISRIKQIILIIAYIGPFFVFGSICFYLFKTGQLIPALFVLLFTLFIAIDTIKLFDEIKFDINYEGIVINDIVYKINKIKKELDLLPYDELLSDIKKIKRKSIEELIKQLNNMKKIYFKNMFKNVYVLIPPNIKLSNEIKKAYSVIAEKYFKTKKIKFITLDDIKNEIEKLESIYSKDELESLNDKFIKIISKDYDTNIKRNYIDFKKF